jgi:hypothetical protein
VGGVGGVLSVPSVSCPIVEVLAASSKTDIAIVDFLMEFMGITACVLCCLFIRMTVV